MTTAPAGIVAPAVVITKDVSVVAPQMPVRLPTLLLPAAKIGVTPWTKKNGGYRSVMVPSAGNGFIGVNETIAEAPILPALR